MQYLIVLKYGVWLEVSMIDITVLAGFNTPCLIRLFVLSNVLKWVIVDFCGFKHNSTTSSHNKNEEVSLGLTSFKPGLWIHAATVASGDYTE